MKMCDDGGKIVTMIFEEENKKIERRYIYIYLITSPAFLRLCVSCAFCASCAHFVVRLVHISVRLVRILLCVLCAFCASCAHMAELVRLCIFLVRVSTLLDSFFFSFNRLELLLSAHDACMIRKRAVLTR